MKPDLSWNWQAVPAPQISRWVWMVEFHDKLRNLAVTLTSSLCHSIDTAQFQAAENSILCRSTVIGLCMLIFEKQDVWEITYLMPIEVSTASLLTYWNVFPDLLPSILTWGAASVILSPSLIFQFTRSTSSCPIYSLMVSTISCAWKGNTASVILPGQILRGLRVPHQALPRLWARHLWQAPWPRPRQGQYLTRGIGRGMNVCVWNSTSNRLVPKVRTKWVNITN